MTETPDHPFGEDSAPDAREEHEGGETMADVDHTHPDTDESFTETGVYERGTERSDGADEVSER